MKMYSAFDESSRKYFLRLKRKTTGPWTFVVAGEWSESPYHSGRHSFSVRSSKDKRYWALLSTGFPSKIAAVAETSGSEPLEIVTAEMMQLVQNDGGGYIEDYDDQGDEFDFDALWDHYCA